MTHLGLTYASTTTYRLQENIKLRRPRGARSRAEDGTRSDANSNIVLRTAVYVDVQEHGTKKKPIDCRTYQSFLVCPSVF